MTTPDTFTEAARKAGPKDWPAANAAFVAGAEWARIHLAAQEPTDAERAVRELHERAWNGTLDYCRRCLDYEGAIYPCATIQALDSARAARRDEERRDG